MRRECTEAVARVRREALREEAWGYAREAAAALAATEGLVAGDGEDHERDHAAGNLDELLQIALDDGVHALVTLAGEELRVGDVGGVFERTSA